MVDSFHNDCRLVDDDVEPVVMDERMLWLMMTRMAAIQVLVCETVGTNQDFDFGCCDCLVPFQ